MSFTIADAIEAFDYPGIDFTYVQPMNDLNRVVLIGSCTRPCSVNPDTDFTVTRAKMVRWEHTTLTGATRSLRSLVLYIEAHEADERIKVNGEAIYNPHTWKHTPTP